MEIDLTQLNPDIRKLSELEKVVYDKKWLKEADKNSEQYFMYRGVEENNGIRYDITVVPGRMMGDEFSKTKGHYHINGYQEIYQVIDGNSIYLLQKKKEGSENEIEDVYAVMCGPGDVLVIPPNYGHITINPSETLELKMANWISSECKSDYSLFEKYQGACYWYLKSGWVKNPNYTSVPELRFEEPLKELPKNLDFLKQS